MSAAIRARTFLLGTYHDLPNVLWIGCVILGAVMGQISLVWLGFGLLLNAASIAALQGLSYGLATLFPAFGAKWLMKDASAMACTVMGDRTSLLNSLAGTAATSAASYVVPSQWIGAVAFFAVFMIYNAIRVILRPAAYGANPEKVENRYNLSGTVIFANVAFLTVILARALSGCETALGVLTGLLVGGGVAVGYWHLLDICGTGITPDVLQVVGSMAPGADAAAVPVVCTAPPEGFQPFRPAAPRPKTAAPMK